MGTVDLELCGGSDSVSVFLTMCSCYAGLNKCPGYLWNG